MIVNILKNENTWKDRRKAEYPKTSLLESLIKILRFHLTVKYVLNLMQLSLENDIRDPSVRGNIKGK